MPEPNSLFKISPIPLTYGIDISHIGSLHLVRRPITRQDIVPARLIKLLAWHSGNLVLVYYIMKSMSTFREHNLTDIKLMLVQRIVATGYNLETVLEFMTIHVGKQSAMGNMVWWHVAEQSAVIEVLEWEVPWGSIDVGVWVDKLTDQVVWLIYLL